VIFAHIREVDLDVRLRSAGDSLASDSAWTLIYHHFSKGRKEREFKKREK